MIRTNPDKDFVKEMRDALKKNNGFCPCNIHKNKDTKCRCKEFRDQIARGEEGFCHCGLYEYVKEEAEYESED